MPADVAELINAISALNIKQLKTVIDEAGLDRSACTEKDDLRVLAAEAAQMGIALPAPQRVAPPPIPPPVMPPPIPPVGGGAPAVAAPVQHLREPFPELLAIIDELSVTQWQEIVDKVTFDRSHATYKEELRELAIAAALHGSPLPIPGGPVQVRLFDAAYQAALKRQAEADARASARGRARSASVIARMGGRAPPSEIVEIEEHWSEAALRIQLHLLGVGAAAAACGAKSDLVDLYWKHLEDPSTNVHFVPGGAEYEWRWLRVTSLDKDTQARRFVEAVTGITLPAEMSLQEGLKGGELLCDFVSVFLDAMGKPPLEPYRTGGRTGKAIGGVMPKPVGVQETLPSGARLRAKQTENVTLYQKACLTLGLPSSHTFDPEDLIEGKNMAAVVRNLHAVAAKVVSLVEYRGPQIGPVKRKERTWVQRAENVATDWRTAGKGATVAPPPLPHGASSVDGAGRFSAAAAAESGNDLSPLEECLADPLRWRDKYTYVDVASADGPPMGEDEAALVWIEACLKRASGTPNAAGPTTLPRPLHAALKTGAVLCRLLHAITPGAASSVPQKLCLESARPFEQMAAIDGYLKGCAALGVTKQTFVTADLHDAKDLRAVTRQLWSLAAVARAPDCRGHFRGPHLGSASAAKAAAEALQVREAALAVHERKEEKRMERERKRIEAGIKSEEIEKERKLIEALRSHEERTFEERKAALAQQ